ncbi:hypothetical protein F5883DRAFT_639988 [Diaporthe sp. PMI_573]|nr:hypothetical protein F5883DRAFT_639988 [Diaporthaceae sp. PMI_573]
MSLEPERRRYTGPRASVARMSTIIREANKIHPQKGSEYHRGTNTEKECWSTMLSPAEYVHLIERVHENKELGEYFDEELRYEYSTSKNKFTILMTVAPLHGTFAGELKELLYDARSRIRKGTEGYEATPEILRTAASDIRPRDHSRIHFGNALLDRKLPDGSYFFKGCKRPEPSLTLEVNCTHHTSEELA